MFPVQHKLVEMIGTCWAGEEGYKARVGYQVLVLPEGSEGASNEHSLGDVLLPNAGPKKQEP